MTRPRTGPVRLLTTVADALMDKAVIPGYSRLGAAARRHWWPADPDPEALAGRRVVVTGAGSGLGRATALGLARLGGTVHLVGRSAERLEASAAHLRRELPDADLVLDPCDVSDLADVRRYASELAERVGSLHALVHNAGVMPEQRTESAQGHELSLATHVLGPFLLTELLRDRLAADTDARVLWVSSGGMYATPFTHEMAQDLEFERDTYSGTTAYARTKRMQVIVAGMLAERLVADDTVVHSLHPGWADTPGVRASLPRFARYAGKLLRSPEQGADTAVWLAAAPRVAESTGLFWQDRRPRPITYLPWQLESAEDRQRLWDYCCAATEDTPA